MADREMLGRLVRHAWVRWAQEQPDPKPSWLVPWAELDEGQREVDRRIGEAVAAEAVAAERARIVGMLTGVSPLGFLARHGLRPGAGARPILLAVLAEIEGRTDG